MLGKLQDLALPYKKDGQDLASEPKVGFCRRSASGTRFVINSKEFAGWFPDEKHERAALLWLNRKVKLHKARNAGVPSATNKQWAVTFAKWSSTKGFRAIEFDDPGPKLGYRRS